MCACICFIYDHFARTSTCNCIDISERKYFLQARPSETVYIAWKHTSYTSFWPNFAQRRQWANPRALILNIEGATDHSWLENRSGTKYKIVTSYRYNYSSKILITKPVAPLSNASAIGYFDHSYACIYHLIVEDFVVEIHHRLVVTFFFEVFFWYRSYTFYTRYFSFLNWTWNFLLWCFYERASITHKNWRCIAGLAGHLSQNNKQNPYEHNNEINKSLKWWLRPIFPINALLILEIRHPFKCYGPIE